jgi:hypothetical protein
MHFEWTLRALPRERDWLAPSELGVAFGRGRLGTRREAIVNGSSERHIASAVLRHRVPGTDALPIRLRSQTLPFRCACRGPICNCLDPGLRPMLPSTS